MPHCTLGLRYGQSWSRWPLLHHLKLSVLYRALYGLLVRMQSHIARLLLMLQPHTPRLLLLDDSDDLYGLWCCLTDLNYLADSLLSL